MTSHRSYDGRTKIYIAKKKKKKYKENIRETLGGENDREGFFFFSLLRTRENVTPIGASGSCECVRVVVSTGKNDLYARSLVEDGGERERERDTTVCDGIYIYRLSLCWLRPVLLGPSLRRLYAPPFFFFFFPPEQDEILLPSCDNPCDKKKKKKKKKRDPSESHEKLSSSVLNCCY